MAWYRAGGGGIPSSLKTDMNDVLNKKFGTSTTYPAEGWPDTVNLMGPLPEKTVSGAIVTFSDGADEVPLKSWGVTFPASLDGYSSVDVVHCGKNLGNFSGHAEPTYSGLTITANADGSITFSGTPSRTWAHLTTDFAVDFPIGTYTLSRGASASYAMYIAVKYEDNTTENISMATSASKTFTTSKRIIQIRLDIATLNQSTNYNETVFVQLEVGATMTDFEPYTAPTTATASLGRTIYGGTADVVKGEGESLCGKIVFDGSNDENWTAYAGGNGYLIAVADMERGTWYTSEFAESSPLPKVPDNNSLGVRIGVNNNGVYVVQANTIAGVTDLASFKAYLAENHLTVVYPLDDSEAFTFTPITPTPETALGVNNFWAEQGDTEVTYRADINLALGGQ